MLAVAAACGSLTTTALLDRFVAGYNAGRATAAMRAIAPEPAFRWFSARDRSGPAAYDRSTLRAYLARPHEHRTIAGLRTGYDAERNLVHFSGLLVLAGADRRSFKGAASCASGRPLIAVWSSG
jgi:hypothetical protein